ncbi:hypothetical protein Tco_1065515 [Tanacetum coccineum]
MLTIGFSKVYGLKGRLRLEVDEMLMLNNMADENVPALAPTRSDDQILSFAAWFWNTLTYEANTGAYSFQLDENRFILGANILRESLEITPIDQARQFVPPPSGDAIMNFVNELGYTEELHFVLRMAGIITNTNVDYAKLVWEEFIQAIQTFFANKANLGIATQKGKMTKPHVIPYCRFTKLIICYLGRTHNIHQRSVSPLHLAKEDYRLVNLKFVPKGEDDEVLGIQIPKEMITNNIRNAPYYNAYLEMVAKHDQKIMAEKGGKKKLVSKTDQSKKPATSKQPKPVSSKQSKPPTTNSLQLVDEPDEEQAQPEPEPQGDEADYDLQRGIHMSLESSQPPVGGVFFCEPSSVTTHKLPTVEGKRKGIATDEQRRVPVTEEASTGPSAQPEDDTSANIVRDTPSPTDAETSEATDKSNSEGDTEILNIGEEQGEDVADKAILEEKTAKIDKGQAGSDPGKTPESRPQPKRVLMEEDQAGPNPGQSHVALAGLDPELMHDDFIATMYPQVHESLKHPNKEYVHVENPLSSTETLSSMKNLDAYTYGDYSSDPDLASRGSALEQVCANFEKRHKLQDNTVQGLSSRVFTLELRDLPYKIDETVNEAVKEAVQIELQAPLKERFRDLSEANMKEILHDWMFESGSYRSQPEHVALYEALEASMERDNRDEFLAEKDKSRKRCQDDQDPPSPPTKESEQKTPSSSSKQKSVPHFKQPVDEVPIPDDVNILNSEDTDTTHLPKIKTRPDWLKPIGKSNLSKADLEGLAYKVVRAFHLNIISLQFEMEECHLLLTDQVDLVSSKGHRVVPDVSKPLPLGGPPGQEFYIQRHSAPSDRHAVRSHMWILSVTSLKTYERYGYTYLREIVLRRADYNEYKKSEANFKNLHPNDFEDLYLLHLQV